MRLFLEAPELLSDNHVGCEDFVALQWVNLG